MPLDEGIKTALPAPEESAEIAKVPTVPLRLLRSLVVYPSSFPVREPARGAP
jgi:hypothetical protein